MTKLDIFNAVVTEVTDTDTADKAMTDLSAFMDYQVRDALMVKASSDEIFTQILTIKVSQTAIEASGASNVSQEVIEAMTTVYHLNTMWDFKESAQLIRKIIASLIKNYSLETPHLVALTDRIAKSGWDLEEKRKAMVNELRDGVMNALTEEEEA
jgi:hypothetical protein